MNTELNPTKYIETFKNNIRQKWLVTFKSLDTDVEYRSKQDLQTMQSKTGQILLLAVSTLI